MNTTAYRAKLETVHQRLTEQDPNGSEETSERWRQYYRRWDALCDMEEAVDPFYQELEAESQQVIIRRAQQRREWRAHRVAHRTRSRRIRKYNRRHNLSRVDRAAADCDWRIM